MSVKKLGVGIIGVTPGRSWAAVAHIPALRALPDLYEIKALSTTRLESAQAAAQEFGVPRAFDNHAALVSHPEVDVVAVTVKVPHHFELVTAALDAGKQVYCEWPLGNGLEEAKALAAHAKRAGIANAVGLQARSAPVVNYARDLIRDGYIGHVLSVTLVGSGMNWGPVNEAANAYSADRRNGATMLAIPCGHTIDALRYIVGSDFAEVTGTLAIRRPTFMISDTGETREMRADDQVAVTGRLQDGTVVSAHYRGGMCRGTNMLWEFNGSEGDLRIDAIGGHAQILDLTLSGGRGADQGVSPMEVPARYHLTSPELAGPAKNVAEAYLRFHNDIENGTRSCPNFDDAVGMHTVIDAIEKAAASGQTM